MKKLILIALLSIGMFTGKAGNNDPIKYTCDHKLPFLIPVSDTVIWPPAQPFLSSDLAYMSLIQLNIYYRKFAFGIDTVIWPPVQPFQSSDNAELAWIMYNTYLKTTPNGSGGGGSGNVNGKLRPRYLAWDSTLTYLGAMSSPSALNGNNWQYTSGGNIECGGIGASIGDTNSDIISFNQSGMVASSTHGSIAIRSIAADTKIYGSTANHFITLNTSAISSAGYEWTFPPTNGSNTQVLGTTGSGVLVWQNAATGTITGAGNLSPLFTTSVTSNTINFAPVSQLKGFQVYASPTAVNGNPFFQQIYGFGLQETMFSLDTGTVFSGGTSATFPILTQGNDYQMHGFPSFTFNSKDSVHVFKETADTLQAGKYLQQPFYTGAHTGRYIGEMWYYIHNGDSVLCTYNGKYVDSTTLNTGGIAWTTTWTGFSSIPTSGYTSYSWKGNLVHFELQLFTPGTSNSDSLVFTLPFPALKPTFLMPSFCENGGSVISTANGRTQVGSVRVLCGTNAGGGFASWTTSSGKLFVISFDYYALHP